MKKVINLLTMLVTVSVFTSCDPSYRIVVNNHGKPSTIKVKYSAGYYNSWRRDSLAASPMNEEKSKTKVVPQNLDSTHYQFIVPSNYQVELMPRSIATPIEEITFKTDKDSTVVVKLFGSDWLMLLKQGIVKRNFYKFTINIK